MNRTIIILLTLIALSMTGIAQDKDHQYTTLGVLNGRAWVTWHYQEKLLYVQGYNDHWISTHYFMILLQNLHCYRGGKILDGMPRLNFGGVINAVDAFYHTAENTNIAIGDALSVIAMRVDGEPESTIQKEIEKLRKGLDDHLKPAFEIK